MQVVNTQAVEVTNETYSMVAAMLGLSFMTQPIQDVVGGYLVVNLPEAVWAGPQPHSRRHAFAEYPVAYGRTPRSDERQNITLVNRYFCKEEFESRFTYASTGPGAKPKDKLRSVTMTKSEAVYLDERRASVYEATGERCTDDNCSCMDHRNP